MRSKVFNDLLPRLDIHPVLVDIGASGSPPRIWDRIAQYSIYIGFDPDLREIQEDPKSHFFKAMIVNKAVTSDKQNDEVLFHFTKSPYCSSTLKPDSKSLSDFLFSDLFVVEREAKVQATTLDSIIEELSLSRIDWLKTDSQGTDLRIFKSLNEKIRSRVLAIDIEPGLIDAYIGEDLFVDAHRCLTQNGFWLSDLKIGGAIRMKRSTLREITAVHKGVDEKFVKKAAKKSPGWCEVRYLRTAQWLAKSEFCERDYVLLWIFALLDNQFGFAVDVGIEYEKVFGKDDISQAMKEEPVLLMRGGIFRV